VSGFAKAAVRFLVARPLIAVVLAVVVVGILALHAERQTTPVTHRNQRVGLTDQQQMALGNQQYQKTLREDRARIVSSGRQYERVQRVARLPTHQGRKNECNYAVGNPCLPIRAMSPRSIEAVAARDKPNFVWKVTLLRQNEANAYCLPGGKIVVFTGICR
jgi:Zn-dependent protease with chaperone function